MSSHTAMVLGKVTGGGAIVPVQVLADGTVVTSAVAGASENHLGEVGGRIDEVFLTEFTRPADTTAYTAGDVVQSAATAAMKTIANVARVSGGTGRITSLRLITDKTGITARHRIHIYNAATTVVIQDNLANTTIYSDFAKKIAEIDLPPMSAGTGTNTASEAARYDLWVEFKTVAGRDLFFVIEALDGYATNNGQKYQMKLGVDLN